MSMDKKIRVSKAYNAMKAPGIMEDSVRPVFKALMILNGKDWEAIEADNYRALADAIYLKEAEERQHHLKEEPEPEEAEVKDGQTSSLNMSEGELCDIKSVKMSKETKIRVAKAFRAMKALGINDDKVKPVLKELLKLNHKKLELIEADNYRVLVDAISERDAKETQDHLEEEPQEAEVPERPLKRTKNCQTSSLNMSKAVESRGGEELADETNPGTMLASHRTTSVKRKVSDPLNLKWLRKKLRDGRTSSKPNLAKSFAPTFAKAKSLVQIVTSDIPREASCAEGGVPLLTSPVGSSSQVPLDSFLMSLRKELSGLDVPGIVAADSAWQVAHALRQFASGAFSLICAQEGMQSSHATVSKLQAEAIALRLEVAEANRGKATALENLEASQGVVQSLLEEIKGMKAEREVIQATLARERELAASKKELEAGNEGQILDSAIKQVALKASVDSIRTPQEAIMHMHLFLESFIDTIWKSEKLS